LNKPAIFVFWKSRYTDESVTAISASACKAVRPAGESKAASVFSAFRMSPPASHSMAS
jgi:hypothetical protein